MMEMDIFWIIPSTSFSIMARVVTRYSATRYLPSVLPRGASGDQPGRAWLRGRMLLLSMSG